MHVCNCHTDFFRFPFQYYIRALILSFDMYANNYVSGKRVGFGGLQL